MRMVQLEAPQVLRLNMINMSYPLVNIQKANENGHL